MLNSNPYRKKSSKVELFIKILQISISSAEFLLVLYVPPYRNYIRSKAKRPLQLLVVGAQKSGTTWLHVQFEKFGLAAVSPIKECFDFDRAGIDNYLKFNWIKHWAASNRYI